MTLGATSGKFLLRVFWKIREKSWRMRLGQVGKGPTSVRTRRCFNTSSTAQKHLVSSDRRRANNKYMPVELSTPQFHLTGSCIDHRYEGKELTVPPPVTGHKSIVNTTLIHPVLPLILTAGIERHILVHSPTPAVPFSSDLRLTPVDIRRLPAQSTAGRERYRQAILALPAGETFADDDPTTGAETQDQETIDLFDE